VEAVDNTLAETALRWDEALAGLKVPRLFGERGRIRCPTKSLNMS
jgi:hypothetical protein